MTADERAHALLRSVLPSDQVRDLDARGHFSVVGSAGGMYDLRVGRSGNIVQEADGKVLRYCIHPVEIVPDADVVLAQVLLLWADEPAFLATANCSSNMYEAHPLIPTDLPTNGDPLLPSPVHPMALARCRFIKRCLQTPEGRESLAQAILARIRHGVGATIEVAAEVTQFARMIVAKTDEPEPGPGVLAVRDWLHLGQVVPE